MGFEKATKRQARLRMTLDGPAGSGKTYSALAIATALAAPDGATVAVIDTERGSASKYAGLFDFDVLELDRFDVGSYVAAIREAEAGGYGVLIIDSLSHAWAGTGGILEVVDRAQAQSKGNSYVAWAKATPEHNRLIDTILGARMHVIATMRSKMGYVLEKNEYGKEVPRKVGMQPIQRDGVEYEFDVVGDLDQSNTLTITKTRCPALTNGVIQRPGAEFAATLRAWLTDGAPVLDRPATTAPPAAEPRPLNDPQGEGPNSVSARYGQALKDAGLALRDISKILISPRTNQLFDPDTAPIREDVVVALEQYAAVPGNTPERLIEFYKKKFPAVGVS